MNDSYSSLLPTFPHSINEEKQHFSCLTERHLQAIWLEQKYLKNIFTAEGEKIDVISPGIWNAEAGPDFLKAHLKIGSMDILGDVEIHLNEESWCQHQHHLDDRYNQVVLHVGLWKPKNDRQFLFTKNGKQVICTRLEDQLTIPIERILKLIDLDLYPYKHFLGSGRCAHALFRTLSEKKVINFFKSAARWRLGQKRDYLKAKAEDASSALITGITLALGYKHNVEAFVSLLIKLLKQIPKDEPSAMAFCLGSCGFFEEFYQQKWSKSEKYLTLQALYLQLKGEKESIKLSCHQVRPLNHPIRRMVVLSKMIGDSSLLSLYSTMARFWENNYSKVSWAKLRKHFQGMLPNYQDAYWNSHYTFEPLKQNEYLPLMGQELKNVILINAFLPLLQEEVENRGIYQEIQAFEDFYGSFPGSKTGKMKYLIHRFFGDSVKGTLINKADLEQGLYQVHRDFCIHFEASCRGCPFVENYTTTFGR